MKKVNERDKLREEYTRADFPGGFMRGKYAQRLRECSNIVVIEPEVAEAFPNEEAVNNALLALIKVTQNMPTLKKSGRRRKRRAV